MIRAGMKCKCPRARGLSPQMATSRQACPRGSLRPASTKPVCQARLAHPNRLCPGIGCQSARTWPQPLTPPCSPDSRCPCAGWQTGRRRRFRWLAAEKASATPSPSTRRSTGSRGRLSYPQLTHTHPTHPCCRRGAGGAAHACLASLRARAHLRLRACLVAVPCRS